MSEDAPQRVHPLREVFNGLRWLVRAGSVWRLMPHGLPPRQTVYQQTQRWIKASVFETMVADLRVLVRVFADRNEEPSATILDSRTLQSSVESGGRAGYDGAKRHKGRKVHMAVDTLGHRLTLPVTPCQRAGAESGRSTDRGGADGDRGIGSSRLCGSGLYG